MEHTLGGDGLIRSEGIRVELNLFSVKDKYLFLGVLLGVIQYIIFGTIDFIIFGSLCLHHIPELFGFLFFGFWFAHNFMWWHTIIVYLLNIPLTEILFRRNITREGMIASAIVSSTLLIGDWFKRCQEKQHRPQQQKGKSLG